MAALVLAAPAAGADVVVGLSVRQGPLDAGRASVVSEPGSRRVAVSVVDARGTGKGWVLSASSPAGTGGAAIVSAEVGCAPKVTCTLPRSAVQYPVTLGAAHSASVLTARAGTGMGMMTVVLTLNAPARSGRAPVFTIRPA